MLRLFIRFRGQINFVQKCASCQTKRTFAEKGSTDRSLQKGKDSKFLFTKKLKNSITSVKKALVPWPDDDNLLIEWMRRPPLIPQQCDVVIIGGGVMGSSIAFWLKKRIVKDLKVLVIEKDPMYTTASTVLSVGGLRQQFSLEENIEMSLFGAEFIRNINEYLNIHGDSLVDPCFHPYGYLMLASETGALYVLNLKEV